jgi:predicted GNAT superfamily acetyltransferase
LRVPAGQDHRDGGAMTAADHEEGPATGIEIRVVDDAGEQRRVHDLFDLVWGTRTSVVGMELIRAIGHAGGYVAAAYGDDQVIGGSLGFLGRHLGAPSLHSHVTGILPGVRHTGLGRAMKLHQRAWAAANGLPWITWTFDPLVRRNAWFNLGVLGAEVHEYLVDFYGPIADAINAGDETDRLLVAWAVGDGAPIDTPPADPTGTSAVPTPDDIVVLRRTDPVAAEAWRERVRRQLGGALADGARVRGFTRDGDYLVAADPDGGSP